MPRSYVVFCRKQTDEQGREFLRLHRPDTGKQWLRVFDPDADLETQCDAAVRAAIAPDTIRQATGCANGLSRVYFITSENALAREEGK